MLILYAEDDLDDLDTFNDILALIDPKIKCIHARNGDEALSILDDATILPDYIFLDINMPIRDGKSCLIEIKKDHRFQNIPVVIYTTSNRTSDLENFKALGAHHYIVKPNTFKEAVERLSKFLRS
jgi:CheY-like chemotaxis protein